MITFPNTTWGARLAGLWFVLTALFVIVGLTFEALPLLMAILALIAGILLMLGK